MITHDIVFHGPRTFDVEIDGAIRHAFTFGARTQRFEVETIGLLSRDDIYGGELEPLFLRLKENTPDGLNIVYILNGGKSLNDGLDDWLLSQMDPYVLPQLNMSPTETAGIRLQTGGAEFESSMAFGLKAHEIPLSSQMALGGNITLAPALNSATLETVADIMTEAIVYLSDRDELRLTTGITHTILKTITLEGEDDMALVDMDGVKLKTFGERQVDHLGSLGLRTRLRSRKAEMRNGALAEGSNKLQFITSADVSETLYDNIGEVMHLEAPVTEATLDVAVNGRNSYMTMTNILSEEVKTGREIVPKQQITGMHIGRGTQPYLRYYDPERISELDMETIFGLGEPNETVTLSSIVQSGNTMQLDTNMVLDEYVSLQRLVVKITPTQNGSGIPSSTNIRTIDGWTGANILVFPSLESDQGQTYHIDWENDGVVCGGTLDVIGGCLTVDWVMLQVADLIVFNNTYTSYISSRIDPGFNISSVMSDRFSTQVASGTAGKMSIVSERQVYFNIPIGEVSSYDTAGVKAWAETHRPQIVVKPSTTITYQLTPTEVRVLLGLSTVSADCGEIEM